MKKASTVYLLICVVIGVAGGVLLAPANWASTTLFATQPYWSVALAGLWLLPAVVGTRILRRPGTALMIGLISGLVIAPFSGYGFGSVATNLWWAAFIEIPFLLILWRRWYTWLYFVGAVLVGLIYPYLAGYVFGAEDADPIVVLQFYGLTLLSCVLCTAVGLVVADQVVRTGVARTARGPEKWVPRAKAAAPSEDSTDSAAGAPKTTPAEKA